MSSTVAGPDARAYLHGQVEPGRQTLAAGESRWTLVLAPNGRVEVLARVLCAADDRFELDTEAGFGDVLADRLNRFRIRVKAELEPSTADLPGETPARRLVGRRRVARTGVADYGPHGWQPGGRRWAPRSSPASGSPAEIGVVPVAVNFTKGCYPGQELVERMDSAARRRRASCASSRVDDADRRSGADVESHVGRRRQGARLRQARRRRSATCPVRPAAERPGGRGPWRTPGR